MIGVGIIGAGLMGSVHARILATGVVGAEVVALCDPDRDAADRVAREHGVGVVYHDAFELIVAANVDAVIVASPVFTHEPFTLACIEAGKPVLCEKPLTSTRESAQRIVEAEAAVGRRLVTVGFMRRFDPGYLALKAQLDAGVIGQPLLVHAAHRNPFVHEFFDSAMIITDSVVHEADVTRWLLGEEIVEVDVKTPRATSRAREGLQDPQLVLMRSASGVLTDVEAFVTAGYAYDIRCEVVGEDGTLSLAAPATTTLRRASADAAPLPHSFEDRFATAYLHQLQAWVGALARGEAPTGPGAQDGFAAATICEAGVASLRSGASTVVG